VRPLPDAPAELVETLSLPPGAALGELDADSRPRNLLEARIIATLLARELGGTYRRVHGITLRADASALEAVYPILLSTYARRTIRSTEELRDIHRHGALFSEILARRAGAEWVDIDDVDAGHWSMIVPPNTRVWPFGRIARVLALGAKDRDLVHTFRELVARAGR
jgi:hypothetical protein